MNLYLYRGLPLYTFLIEKRIKFKMDKEHSYDIMEYKIYLTSKKIEDLNLNLDEDYNVVYCKNLNIDAVKIRELIGEDIGDFEIFIL